MRKSFLWTLPTAFQIVTYCHSRAGGNDRARQHIFLLISLKIINSAAKFQIIQIKFDMNDLAKETGNAELEKCMKGEWYDCHAQIFVEMKTKTRKLLSQYNTLPYDDKTARYKLLCSKRNRMQSCPGRQRQYFRSLLQNPTSFFNTFAVFKSRFPCVKAAVSPVSMRYAQMNHTLLLFFTQVQSSSTSGQS